MNGVSLMSLHLEGDGSPSFLVCCGENEKINVPLHTHQRRNNPCIPSGWQADGRNADLCVEILNVLFKGESGRGMSVESGERNK